MAVPRFFVDETLVAGTTIALPQPVAHHAAHVLRLRDGDGVVLFNGRGGEFRATLRGFGRDAGAHIDGFDAIEREALLAATLVQAWVAADKLDWIVGRAVELGAAAIVLAPAERCVVRIDGERRSRRLAHLRQLARSACEQCGRNLIPAVEACDDLVSALDRAASLRTVLLPGDAPSLARRLRTSAASDLALLVGPEGGFSRDELRLAKARDWQPATLGPRVLRTETAGAAALAVVQAVAGDLR